MQAFQLEMHEMHKIAVFHSNLLVSWELLTEGYQGRPVKCVHLMLKYVHFENPNQASNSLVIF